MHLTNLVRGGMIVLKRMKIPLYSSKYSKRTYTIHQHLLCLCLKELQKQSYRDCRDFLEEFDHLQEVLGLTRVPHYTTPQKCLHRFPPRWYRFLLRHLTCLVKSRASAVIDGTGVMQTTASFSYITRIGRHIRKRDYFKILMTLDPSDGFILMARGVPGNRHESPLFIPLLEEIPCSLKDVCGDKGFDSEANHNYVVNERQARSFVAVRDVPHWGRYRKRVYRWKKRNPDQWNHHYTQMRNAIESKNFSFKHRFGDFIPGKTIHSRRRYLCIRVFAANLLTLQKPGEIIFLLFVTIEDFYSPYTR